MLRLATPLAMAELGWMGMRFFPIVICGTGMLTGMDTVVAQAFGAREDAACRRTLVQGMWSALAIGPVVSVLLALTVPLLRAIGTNAHVMELLGPYIRAL